MNILVLCTPDGRGGLELYAEREARFIATESSCICHLVVRESGHINSYVREGEVPGLYLQWCLRGLPVISATKLARYIDENCIDIIHMHWGKDLGLAALAKFLSSRKPKLVYTRHMGITRPKKDPYHRFLYGQVDQVLGVSKQVRKEAIRFLPLLSDQVKLLYLGVPAMKESKEAGHCVQLPDKENMRSFNIGMFGRIEHGKGQHVLVDAVAMLVKQGLDISATVIGHVMDEHYFKQLKQTIQERGLSDRVRFVGFVDDPMAVMPCFDVVTLLTYCETFGLVLIEAMRAGVAVVGTNAGGVPEIIRDGETGLLTPPGDSVVLAENLRRLYEDETLKEWLAQEGKKRADSVFDEEISFNVLIRNFRELNKVTG